MQLDSPGLVEPDDRTKDGVDSLVVWLFTVSSTGTGDKAMRRAATGVDAEAGRMRVLDSVTKVYASSDLVSFPVPSCARLASGRMPIECSALIKVDA